MFSVSECELDEDLEPLAEKNMVFIRQLPQDIESKFPKKSFTMTRASGLLVNRVSPIQLESISFHSLQA